jgi:hypothetical protein
MFYGEIGNFVTLRDSVSAGVPQTDPTKSKQFLKTRYLVFPAKNQYITIIHRFS